MKIYIIFGLIITHTLLSKNLILHDYDNPSASHILDAEIQDNLLILSGMIGGIEFYDISNPEVLNHLGNLQLSGGGGGGTKPNCIVASGSYAYLTTSQGLGVINISNPSNPQYLGIVSGTNNYILENLDVYDDFLAVAAHEDGVLFYDISNPSVPEHIYTLNTVNAWAVQMEPFEHINYEFVIYVADQNSIFTIAYMYYNNHHDFAPIDNIFLNSDSGVSTYKDIAFGDGIVYFAKGSDGVDVYQTSGSMLLEGYEFNCYMHVPCYLDTYNTSVMANRIAVFDDKLAVSDWDDVEILEWDGYELALVGYKNTTRRTMAIATKGRYIYSAEWASVQVFEYGEVEGADIDLDMYELNYPYVDNGNSYTLFLEITNNGNQSLNVIDAYTTNSEFSYTPLDNLGPNESQIVEVTYTANLENASGSYRIYSNDPDENEIICETNGNINGANVGDQAQNFNLPIIANGDGSFELSDNLGKVVVLAFFSPN